MKGGKSIFVSLMQKALGLLFHHLHPWRSVYLVFGASENTGIFQSFPSVEMAMQSLGLLWQI